MDPMTRGTVLPRRKTLQLGGALFAVGAAAVSGCDAFSTEPAESADGPAEAAGLEAPSLAKLVESGDLPPLDERLPGIPLVVEPERESGPYGGTWASFLDGPARTVKFYREVGYDSLVRWSPDWSEVIPNLAESWDVENDGRAYVLRLREGVRWSDGAEFTADDLVFSIDAIVANDVLTPVPPQLFSIDGELATIEKLDDYTVRFDFPEPSGLFLRRLATPDAWQLLTPRHYLEEFHIDYNSAADDLAGEQGFASWDEYFFNRRDPENNPDRPTLNAWMLVTPVESGKAQYDRNPYYWKVDPDGRQLPYIDHVSYDVLEFEVALLRTTNGELHLNAPQLTAGVTTVDNKPVLAQAREDGGYRFIDGLPASMNYGVIALNLNHPDEAMREVFLNKDFRIGVSYAINRAEIIDVAFQRQGEPWQAAPRPESDAFDEELARQYTEYDVELANEHLDTAGFDQRDNAGFRVRADGQRIRFNVDLVTNEPNQIRSMELIKDYWAEVGIDARLNTIDRTLFYERKEANQHDASIWTGDGGLHDAAMDPRWYFPFSGESNYALLWAEWYNSRGASGAEPPEAAVQQMELYDRYRVSVDEDELTDLFNQILRVAREQFWVIGIALPVGIYGTVRTDFHNVPDDMPAAWLYPNPGPARPEQFYISAE